MTKQCKSMDGSNDPVDGHKDERQQGVVHKGEPGRVIKLGWA